MQSASALRYSADVLQPVTQVLSFAHSQTCSLGCVAAHDLLQLQRCFSQHYPVLLQSVAATNQHQHDILMAFPQQRLTLLGNGQLQLPDAICGYQGNSFLEALDHWWRLEQSPIEHGSKPFFGGWFLFLGYELVSQIESSVKLECRSSQIVAQAMRIPAAIIRDSQTSEAWFVAEHEHASKLDEVLAHLKEVQQSTTRPLQSGTVTTLEEEVPEVFLDAVSKALEYIAAGDIYQANLSRGWQATLPDSLTAQDLYRQLCIANPAPFAGIVLLSDEEAIISSSPERLINIQHGEVSTRPIAGTRPRSSDHQRDVQLVDELRRSAKEQAEHVMLLDLERNDLGRICEAGTVKVDEFMVVESYTHVHHIVSNVRGKLRNDVTPGRAIAAVFPGGTITGCPKVRCMQVIAELEKVWRGPYTGSMGYLNRDGSMDLNILIRTLHLKGNNVEFRAGAGIVADSIPERELDETRAKALGLLRALGAAAC